MTSEDSSVIELPQMNFVKFLFKILAGLGGGLAGMLLVLVIYLATASFLEPLSRAEESIVGVSPIFLLILLLMVFLGSLGGNILGALFTYFVDRNKYQKIYSTIIQIVISNVILLFLLLPIYFLAAGVSITFVAYVAALHFILSAQMSNLTLEIAANPQYGLLGVYSTVIAIVFSMIVLFAIYRINGNGTILLFASLPVIWSAIGFSSGVVDAVYSWIVKVWGIDFAASNTRYGRDYSPKLLQKEAADAELHEENKDVSGSDFLRQ